MDSNHKTLETMKRGEVWEVKLIPVPPSNVEISRFAVIVSSNFYNRLLNRVQVVPFSNSVDKIYGDEAMVMLKGVPHKAMTDQIRTVSKRQLTQLISELSSRDMERVENAIKSQLDI